MEKVGGIPGKELELDNSAILLHIKRIFELFFAHDEFRRRLSEEQTPYLGQYYHSTMFVLNLVGRLRANNFYAPWTGRANNYQFR